MTGRRRSFGRVKHAARGLPAAAAGLILAMQGAAIAETRSCGADTEPRPLPLSLAPEVTRLFGIHGMPPEDVARTTVARCAGGRLLVCTAGANLPCGKANVSRTLPAAVPWCAEHPDADFVPAYISGHDSIYSWRCREGVPATTGAAERVDAEGYVARYWKALR